MKRLIVSAPARRDVLNILAASYMRFGVQTRRRYRRLIQRAFADLNADPARPGVQVREGLPPELRLYHLRHSRGGIAAQDRIGNPRHFIVFQAVGEVVEISRVLHDSMDLAYQLAEPESPNTLRLNLLEASLLSGLALSRTRRSARRSRGDPYGVVLDSARPESSNLPMRFRAYQHPGDAELRG